MRNYPDPDPAWHYYEIYQQVTQAHAKIEQLLEYFASPECENESAEADEAIASLLLQARQLIDEAASKLNTTEEKLIRPPGMSDEDWAIVQNVAAKVNAAESAKPTKEDKKMSEDLNQAIKKFQQPD